MARFFKHAPFGAKAPDPAPAEGKTPFSQVKPDPDRIGISGAVPFVRLPDPKSLFARRAERLRLLAPGHPLQGYLELLARLAEAQAQIQAEFAAIGVRPDPPAPETIALRLENGMPPLARDLVTGDPVFAGMLTRLLECVDLDGAPEAARTACGALRTASEADRLDLALQIFEGAFPVERMAECVFVAAALQVYLAEQAGSLDAAALQPVADGVCPACGGAPTASIIVSWTPADKARYLSCSACSTLWNHVRIRCTACGSGEDVSYLGLDEVSKDVQVETCGHCRAYLKHLHQHRDPGLDPIADDVASYGLDLKVAEEDFRRAGLNLLFVT